MKIFESFKDNTLNEAKVLSPKNVKEFDWNKRSVKDLKNWSFKIKDLNIEFKKFEFWGDKPRFNEFLNNSRENISDYLYVIINNDFEHQVEIEISDKLNFSLEGTYKKMLFLIDEKTYYNFLLEDDKILGFTRLLDFLFNKFSKEIYDSISEVIQTPKLYVIPAGNISPVTGKTGHGWSIYDNKNGVLFYSGRRDLLYSASGAGNTTIGDKFKVLDDQSHKVLHNEFEVKEIIKTNYDDFVKFSKKEGAKIPVGAYKKQPGSFSFRLLSIK